MNIQAFARILLQSCRSAAATTLALASLTMPAWATLTSVSPTSTAINVASGGSYSFTVTGSVGETPSTQSRFCFDVGVSVPANGIIFPAAGGCTPSSVIPINPVVTAGTVYRFFGFVTPAQAATMVSEAAAAGQPAGSRFVYWRQGFGTSGFAIVRVNLIEPVVVASPPTLSPSSLNFGNVTVNSSSAGQVMTLTNPGPGPISITGAGASTGFTFSSNCTGTLTANASCQFTVVFSPTAAQTYNGQLTITTTGGTVNGGLSGTGVPATITPPSLTPASVNFGNVQLGQTSAPQTLTFASNTAATHPTLDIVRPTFVNLTTTCPTSLTSNLTCNIMATCAPTSPGPQSGTITVVAGSLNVSSSVTCTGVAAAPPTLSPASASFGDVLVGAASPPQVFTLSNPSNTPVTGVSIGVGAASGFSQTSSCIAGIAANSSCQISVTFTPTAAQPYSGLLRVVTAAGMLNAALFGNGVLPSPPPAAIPSLTPASANFGSVAIGASAGPQSFTLTNSGNTALTSLVINVAPGFGQTSTCTTALAAGASCQILVSFAPTIAQVYSGLLTVTAGASSLSSALSGTGTMALPPPSAIANLAPSSTNFGAVIVGAAPVVQSFTLTNSGNAPFAGLAISVPPGFGQTSTCGTALAAGASCQINVSFAPTIAQVYSGLLTVTTGANSVSSALSGSATAAPPPPSAIGSLAPASTNFGAVTVGAPAVVQSFTLTNSGNAPLSGLVINVPPGFTQLSNCGTSLAAGASCQLNVSFVPTSAQAYSGLLTVVTGASSLSSALSGVGAAAPIVSVASTLTDVSPKRLVGNVSSDLTQVLSYTFSGNTTNVSPGEGIFCFDLVPGLSPGNTTSGNPCTSGSQFARHPTIASAFQSTRVGAVIRSVRETIRVPSAVSRFARESGRSRYFFARQFSPNQYAVITIELLGNVANQPIAITDMRMYFKQGGEQPIVFLKRGDALPTIEARLLFTGSGFLRGAWEVVQPGDVDPTDTDLTPDASLPLEQRGLQRRYSVVGTFQQYLPAVGQVTLTPPDLSRFPVTVDGGYRVLLRLFADPAIGGAESDGRLASGGAGFALPTARYFVGSFASHGTTSKLVSISVSLPSVNHAFSAAEPVNFRWQAVRDAAVYLLEAAGEGGNVVAAAQVPASDVELNAGYSAPTPWRAQAVLGTGAVRWRVTAYGRDGEALARSDWRGVRF